jgi:hypothetical protein
MTQRSALPGRDWPMRQARLTGFVSRLLWAKPIGNSTWPDSVRLALSCPSERVRLKGVEAKRYHRRPEVQILRRLFAARRRAANSMRLLCFAEHILTVRGPLSANCRKSCRPAVPALVLLLKSFTRPRARG